MPHPLPEALTAVLRLDRTAALAAAFIIGTHHVDVLQWVARTLCGDAPEPQPQRQKANARRRRGRKGNSHRKSRNNGDDPYLRRRRAQRDETDTALLEVMRSLPRGSIGDWAEATSRSRTSTVSALHRLRDAGVAESVGGKWRLVEPEAPRAPRWVEPVSAVARREHAGG
jgi:hypothetical protein